MKRPPEVLRDDEIRALLNGCSHTAPTGIRNRALIAVMWRTGLRIGEALALSPRDVDLDSGELHVQHGKGDKARRLGIDPEACALLARWVDCRPASQYLFCSLAGRQMDQSYVRSLLLRLKAKAGLECRCHPHALRHTFASNIAVEGNVPIHVLRDMLGHSSVATTDQYLRAVAPRAVVDSMRARTWN
jgi:site-specific recombinase XerD